MRLLIERVKYAKCVIDNKIKSEINKGLLCYVAFSESDTYKTIDDAIAKISKLRIFTDNNDKMNLSVKDILGEVLIISSFSLYGDTKGNNRPSFVKSLKYDDALLLYNYMIKRGEEALNCKSGSFGADMMIEAINDGPVSIIIDF